ncbi:MAG TPA: hypothetical protein VF125_13030 [Solirubrobacterales bacterium]
MYRRIMGVVLGVAVIAVLASGCGGGDSTDTVTKAEFVEQGKEICAKRKKDWTAALASYEKKVVEEKATQDSEVQEEIATGILKEKMVPAMEVQLQEFEDLGTVEGSEKQSEKMLKTLSVAVAELENKGIGGLRESKYTTFEEEAKELGLTCPI